MKKDVKKISRYSFSDPFGDIVTFAQAIYLDGEEFLEDFEIERLSVLTAVQFVESNRLLIKSGRRVFSERELNHCLVFFRIQAGDLSHLLNIDKSVVSRQRKGGSSVTSSQSSILLDLLIEEIREPGFVQRKIRALKSAAIDGGSLSEMEINPRDIALLLIAKFKEHKAELTKLKLHKLLYYVQGMGIALYNAKIFNESFVAYKNGPILESIYRLTKKYKTENLAAILPDDRVFVEPDPIVSDVTDAVFERYGRLEPWALVESTHREKPWRETKQSAKISDKLMIQEFRGKYL